MAKSSAVLHFVASSVSFGFQYNIWKHSSLSVIMKSAKFEIVSLLCQQENMIYFCHFVNMIYEYQHATH